ncbi:50S ribosomal protein L10 [uncultured Microscilla sp.]|uniref:50S ribosomal protein L10 n=1 Tax=uncultured Microscilla sp. TaxID=432653 RepID=UPI002635635F|nr:50S ribosomal protein L10 [uncultured Microscilla sp.]
MTREEKAVVIKELQEKFSNAPGFYITDAAGMNVESINNFRRMCFEKGIEYRVAKNSLIQKALEQQESDYTTLFDSEALKGFSGIMFAGEAMSDPAKVLKKFQKEGNEKPTLKGASIDSAIYIGAEHLEPLSKIKSREEMIAELVGLLQSPGRNLVSALQGSGSKLAGVLKALSDKQEA